LKEKKLYFVLKEMRRNMHFTPTTAPHVTWCLTILVMLWPTLISNYNNLIAVLYLIF